MQLGVAVERIAIAATTHRHGSVDVPLPLRCHAVRAEYLESSLELIKRLRHLACREALEDVRVPQDSNWLVVDG